MIQTIITIIKKLIPQSIGPSLFWFLYKHSSVISQAGQDYWVYGEAFNETRSGYFLDIGANDGIRINNTYILESKYDWSGICIEANPLIFKQLNKNRSAVCLNVCLDKSEGKIDFALKGLNGGIVDSDVDNKESDVKADQVIKQKTISLNRVLEDQQAPSIIDFLSIDVEGAEERILAGFDFHKYTFRCVTIERPTELLRDLFKDHGYILIKEIPYLDCFYIHQTFLDKYRENCFNFYNRKHLSLKIHWR